MKMGTDSQLQIIPNLATKGLLVIVLFFSDDDVSTARKSKPLLTSVARRHGYYQIMSIRSGIDRLVCYLFFCIHKGATMSDRTGGWLGSIV